MTDVKQPEDRQTKAKPFTFKDKDGKTRKLPLASEGATKVPGRLTRDAIMSEDETAQIRLGFALLEACGVDDETLDALYSLDSASMLSTLGEWMQYGDGDGASLPQS